MTTTEINTLLELLKDYSDVLSCRGCNDYTLPDTPENRAMLEEMIATHEDSEIRAEGVQLWQGKLFTTDGSLLAFLMSKLEAFRDVRDAFKPKQ